MQIADCACADPQSAITDVWRTEAVTRGIAGEPLDQVVAKGGEIEALQRLALAQHVGDERQPERVPAGKGQPIGMLVVGNAA